jgi:hypothetical protein
MENECKLNEQLYVTVPSSIGGDCWHVAQELVKNAL